MLRLLAQVMFVLGLLSPVVASAAASKQAEGRDRAVPGSLDFSDRERLEGWLDGLMNSHMALGDMAGATVMVTRGSQPVIAKGYGFADVAQRRIVTDQTVFRVGSISKLFVWTAVMQLVERGDLDLDRDIQSYLDFQVSSSGKRPITLRHIMTHTAGFEDVGKNAFTYEQRLVRPLGVYLREGRPALINQPGRVVAYSNYATVLAAYIVERRSGLPFATYVDRNILVPLKMRSSSFAQPLPKVLQSRLALGYRSASGPAEPFEFMNIWPAGSFSSTAADMGRFAAAFLNGGVLDGQRILRSETVREMLARNYAAHPALSGMALGFYEQRHLGVLSLGHAGDTEFYHSDLQLFPAQNLAIFVSISGGSHPDAWRLRRQLFTGFVENFIRLGQSLPMPSAIKAPMIEGRFFNSRRQESRLFRIGNLFSQTQFSVTADGAVTVDALRGLNGQPIQWRQTEPDVFRQVGGDAHLALLRDKAGTVTGFATDAGAPVSIFERVPLSQNAAWNVPLLLLTLATLAGSTVIWPCSCAYRRWRRVEAHADRATRLLRRATRVGAAASFIFLAGILGFAAQASGNLTMLTDDADLFLRGCQFAGLIGIIAGASAFPLVHRLWKDSSSSYLVRSGYLALAATWVSVLWFALEFHLLSRSLAY